MVVGIVALPGCDVVFGLTGEPGPCELAAFDESSFVDLTPGEDVSVSLDGSFAVVVSGGVASELTLPGGETVPIELAYPALGLGLAPEGDALFYTAQVEPPALKGAVRDAAQVWILDAEVPRGTFAGTPSADIFGPRRVLVRLREVRAEVQEYEDVNGVWTPVGEIHDVAGMLAPNLTPSGLNMVYGDVELDGTEIVLAASRESTSEWFSESRVILRGSNRSPQLFGKTCDQLFVSDDGFIRRYGR
jgi:hypothetical protein